MHEHIEAALAALGFKVSGGGALISFFGWVFSSAAAAWLGAWVAVAGLALNAYYTKRRDARERAREQREQEEHQARMAQLKEAA